MAYGDFAVGGVLGMLPSLVITTVMGTQIEDPTSPGFIISTALFVLVQVVAALGFVLWGKKHPSEGSEKGEEYEST
jgi:uncharacterized membrane protein YdjX (TVP38/TMEM64 family)